MGWRGGARGLSLAALMGSLTACDGPLSALDPAGPMASSIASLWQAMLAGALALFVLVIGLFAWVMRPGAEPKPRRVDGKRWIVWGGLVMPSIVLATLVVASLVIGERLLARPAADVVTVAAHGQMWRWRFSYPDNPEWGTTDALHIPAGTPVNVVLSSDDVIHAFWVPRLGGKLDAIPGRSTVLRIQADEPGRIAGQCAEFCGVGHTRMSFEVIVHPRDDFARAMKPENRR